MRSPRGYLLALVAAVAPAFAAGAHAQTSEQWAQTASWAASAQNPDGGFGPAPGQPSSLGATSSMLKILRTTGGEVRDILACADYVRSCYDADSGGFAPAPKGKPAVGVTASGLMALGELAVDAPDLVAGAIRYFEGNAKSFEDIRIAVAGLEAVKKPAPYFPRWIEQVEADKNADGTFGKGDGVARATGSAGVALLRMGVPFDEARKKAILEALRAGQRPDGGWGESDKPSDLGSSYRIMRGFWMLKERPDLDKLVDYVSKHRNDDGTYRSAPDAKDAGGTYFAVTILGWARQLVGLPSFAETRGFVPLFNGKDLAGWEGDAAIWSAKDGKLVGTSNGLGHNDFLATEADYDNFALRAQFRLRGDKGSNSGIQFRSVRVPPHEMSGYQADLGDGYWAGLYDESRRNRVLKPGSEKAIASVRIGDWNSYEVRAIDSWIRIWMNGNQSVDYREEDSSIARTGKIAPQVHAGGPLTIELQDLVIQRIPNPRPASGNTPAAGFQVWSVKSGDAERKFTVYFPKEALDSKAKLPVVLFLHGSGERGEDGVQPAQAGLGPAILNAPGKFPAIAIFPQARKSWNDPADQQGALDALKAVLSSGSNTDADRVSLTGLSMGGAGTWSLAEKHPGMFTRIAPVCGHGEAKAAEALKDLPTWVFCGDADHPRAVQNSREMTAALRKAGNKARYTEYKSVGHNSWDRAYSDPEFLGWLLEPKPGGSH